MVGALLAASVAPAHAEARRALVIGINTYQPPTPAPDGKPFRWINLDGAINDAQGMKALLVARFGFAEADIELLTDAAASRQGILEGLQHLVDRSRPGDVAVIFYAGHGSRVKNSLSAERDQWDETMVPADSHRGVPDLTDKEISEKLNLLLDKQALVTAIFDSCHSGSISRGPHRKTRDAAPDAARDTKDGRKLPDPVSRGALILSAAQDYQTASEDVEVVDGKDIPHGAFSVALFNVLRASRGSDPADRIALSLRAMLQSEGGSQEPSLEANAERRRGPLIGRGPTRGGDALAIPVLRIAGERKLELQAGPALGLAKGSVLVLDRKEEGQAGRAPLTIEITAVLGMARAEATVRDGTTKGLRVGIDRFVVQSWVPVSGKGLQLFAPSIDRAALDAALREVATLRAAKQLVWIDDVEKTRPTHVLAWTGSAWRLASADGAAQELGAKLSAASVLQRLPAAASAKLFVILPPTVELRRALEQQLAARSAALTFSREADRAQYALAGRAAAGGGLEYALVQSDLTLPCRAPEGKAAICEPGGGLPAATRWVAAAAAAPALTELAMRLAKVRGWLTLDAEPPQDFPYALALRPKSGGAPIATGTLRDGERYELVLEARPADLEKLIVPRFVYVFALSSDGSSSLLFPRADACGVEARVPFSTSAGVHRQAQVTLASIKIGPPFGVDTYVLLSTQEALPNCAILTSAGVREADKTRGAGSPLQQLVEGIASATRGAGVETPTTWSVERLVFKSAP